MQSFTRSRCTSNDNGVKQVQVLTLLAFAATLSRRSPCYPDLGLPDSRHNYKTIDDDDGDYSVLPY